MTRQKLAVVFSWKKSKAKWSCKSLARKSVPWEFKNSWNHNGNFDRRKYRRSSSLCSIKLHGVLRTKPIKFIVISKLTSFTTHDFFEGQGEDENNRNLAFHCQFSWQRLIREQWSLSLFFLAQLSWPWPQIRSLK